MAGRGRPSKSLEQLVRDETFRARRHHDLLADGDLLRWKPLAALQAEYRDAGHELERRRIAREFENAIPDAIARSRRRELGLDDELEKLGPPGSAQRAVNFFPRFLTIAKGVGAGRRFRLRKFQELYVRDVYARDRQNRRLYPRSLLGMPVGNGKTPLVGGLGLLELVDDLIPKPAIYAVSSSREQAGSDPNDLSRLHALARYWIEEGDLSRWVRASATITCPERHGFFKILPSEGRRGFGVDPTFGLFEELGAFIYPAERAAYDAVRSRLNKRGPRMAGLAAVTNAGWDKGTVLGELYDKAIAHPDLEVDKDGCLRILRDRESGFCMHWYGVPEDADVENPTILGAANPLLSKESVRDLIRDLHAADTDELEWRRAHGNQWTVLKDAWLPLGTWAMLKEERVEIPPGAAISVAVDAARTQDTSCVAWAWRRPDGRVVVKTQVWALPKKAEFGHTTVSGPSIDNEALLEPYVLGELGRRYRIKNVVYDRTLFGTEAKHLAEAGLTVAELFQGGVRMREAENEFFKAAKSGRIVHDSDPVLASHVEATAGKRNLSTGEWKISRLFGRARPIDACVAAVMAHWAEVMLDDEEAAEGGFEWADEGEWDDEELA